MNRGRPHCAGYSPSRTAVVRRAVPPRVGAHAGWLQIVCELAGRVRSGVCGREEPRPAAEARGRVARLSGPCRDGKRSSRDRCAPFTFLILAAPAGPRRYARRIMGRSVNNDVKRDGTILHMSPFTSSFCVIGDKLKLIFVPFTQLLCVIGDSTEGGSVPIYADGRFGASVCCRCSAGSARTGSRCCCLHCRSCRCSRCCRCYCSVRGWGLGFPWAQW